MIKRVLIVEDDSVVANMVAEVLNKIGCQTFIAPTGAEAITLFNAHQPDLILLDIALPDTDGFEVARKVRETEGVNHPTHITIMTAYAQSYFVSKGFEARIDGYLNKPILPQDLEAQMRELTA